MLPTLLPFCSRQRQPENGFTPFQAALCGLLVSLTGSAGSGVLSAIKHNFGIRNWLPDHPQRSMLDGAAGICFAAPVFFHVVRYYWG